LFGDGGNGAKLHGGVKIGHPVGEAAHPVVLLF